MKAASPPKLNLSPGGLGRGQLTARPTRGREALKPSVAPIHLVSQAFPGLEAVGEQPLPGVGSVDSAEAEATLPTGPWARLALWNGLSLIHI